MSHTKMHINKDNLELTMVREFNAPRQLVWNAFTKPELVSKWWGPKAFTTTVKEMDVRPGGTWYYIMHGTGAELKGTEFENLEAPGKAIYEEVVEPERLVYKDVFVDSTGEIIPDMPVGYITYTFEDNGDKTILTAVTKYSSLEELQKVVDMGVEQGMSESLEKLDTLLAK
jgi:uncharacterized protein YndB with AHSA1/START domain